MSATEKTALLNTPDDDEVPAFAPEIEVQVPTDLVEENGEKGGRTFKFSWRKLWAYTGPGWLMSIAYLDPGNLESDLQAGASAGYSLLWVLFWATAAGFLLQLLALRLGVVSGRHLAQHCRERYALAPRLGIWIMTEIAIIGSDIQEVVGSAIALHILTLGYLPLWGGVLVTVVDTFSFLLLERSGIRRLEFLFCILIATMAAAFAVELGLSDVHWLGVLKGIAIPSVPKNSVVQAIGLLGAVVMPHNIYLHSALVLSRRVERKDAHAVHEANIYNAIESGVALIVSFLINASVVSVFASTFYPLPPGQSIGMATAGERLGHAFGPFAKYIWAVGLLAAGQSSTMTGTYAGQFVMDGFLALKIAPWKRVLLTRSVAIVPAILVAVLAQSALDDLGEWLNVLQSIQLPFALIPVLVLSSSTQVMGEFVSPIWIRIICWILALAVLGANVFLVQQFLRAYSQNYKRLK